MTTPQLEYGFKLKIATQNVQGMAEVLKHQQVLEIMKSFSLHILFLTETRSTSYYTYNSQGFLFVVNGSTTDKYAGITAVIHPSIRPYIKDFIQYSPRITRVTISLQSGNSHIFGVYAPHDKLENEEVKSPFWDTLQSAMISLPAPEPAYIIGDFNVRLQGRSRHEHDIMGPHVYGKGYSSAKTGPQQNRTYYTSFLRDTACVDALTYKTPNLLHHITYRDKNPPPQEWTQFALDSIKVLQFWDKIAALPTPPEEALCIAQTIRLFLTADPLLNPLPQTPKIDPFRFQSLDKIVCKKQWLPSILQCRAHHNTGFPSDHYLLIHQSAGTIRRSLQNTLRQHSLPGFRYKGSPRGPPRSSLHGRLRFKRQSKCRLPRGMGIRGIRRLREGAQSIWPSTHHRHLPILSGCQRR